MAGQSGTRRQARQGGALRTAQEPAIAELPTARPAFKNSPPGSSSGAAITGLRQGKHQRRRP
eukprot:2777478-Pyramimonas_sp.AAC.1